MYTERKRGRIQEECRCWSAGVSIRRMVPAWDFLNEVRATDMSRFLPGVPPLTGRLRTRGYAPGATLCMDKMKGLLLQDKLVEYAYRQLSGEPDSTFHKLLFVHAEDTSAGALQAAMLQKGLDLILVSSIADAKCRIFEDEEIELILRSGTAGRLAMELFHTQRDGWRGCSK